MKPTSDTKVEMIEAFLYRSGQQDGSHHRAWVIDQIARIVMGDEYKDFIKRYEDGGEYEWDKGIAP